MSDLTSASSSEYQRLLNQFSSSDELSVLEDRAKAYLQQDSNEHINQEEYIHFRLGNTESYAISYKYVEEILNPHEITYVPCVPDHVAGVVNRRSSLLAVYDLKKLFSLEPPTLKSENIWVIVVSCGQVDYTTCILADEIYGNENYLVDELASPLKSAGVKNLSYVKGIIDGRVTLLDIPAILSDENLKVAQRAT
ncbi:MAG: chemotaxis protein CheW [Coxiellaceae bacterium]|nr:chemotaxis protein CheW [Coxiellaceae bacterium]